MSGAAMLLSDPGSFTYNDATKGDMACLALALPPPYKAHAQPQINPKPSTHGRLSYQAR